MRIKRLVLDVLKPLKEPSIVDLAIEISRIKGVEGVNVTVMEVDVETMTLTVTIEGDDISFEEVKRVIEDSGAVIHSIDQVVAGEKFVEIPPSRRGMVG